MTHDRVKGPRKEEAMGFEWEDYEPDGEGMGFVRWQNIGDKVRGKIIDLREGRGFNGEKVPEIEFQTDDGGILVWTVGQTVAQRVLAEAQPQVGWEIEVRYSGNGEGKPGRAPAKLFEVEVLSTGGGEAAAVAAPATGADL